MRILNRLPQESGRDYALRVIEDNIIRLELIPGSPISENDLAASLGLSRTPVREALIALSKAKMVETAPQKCTVVVPIDRDLMEQARFARCVLELAVLEKVIRHMTIHLDRLRNLSLTEIDNAEVLADHRRILSALRSARLEEARQVMQQHLSRCKMDVDKMARRFPAYFREKT